VIDVVLIAITVCFGAPRATSVLAVVGDRLVNYWLPLVPGALTCLHWRLRPDYGPKANSLDAIS
jgi:uncharacterized membrane protein YbhN (UPF0104 family)